MSLVVCGAGHMGRRALCLFPLLRSQLACDGIDLRLAGVIDRETRTHGEILGLLEALLIEPTVELPSADLSKFLTEHRARFKDPLLVYDGSPVASHIDHLLVCVGYQVHYLGEKPVVTSMHDLRVLKEQIATRSRPRLFVDMIETHSLAFRDAVDRMANKAFVPGKFEFFRQGPGGLKKLLSPQARKGVAGGALLDKAIHDLGLLYGFLRAGGRDPMATIEISVESFALMPADMEAVMSGQSTSFMGTDNVPRSLPRGMEGDVGYEAADARCGFVLGGEDWKASFQCSWLGVPSSTTEKLAALGLPNPEDHVAKPSIPLFGGPIPIRLSDGRFCALSKGQDNLVIDFGYKEKEGTSTSIHWNGTPANSMPDPFSDNSLGRVLVTVCRALSNKQAPLEAYIDEAAMLWVHEKVLCVRDRVLEQAAASAQETFDRARGAVKEALGEAQAMLIGCEMSVRGVIFDMDNTLFSTAQAVPNLESLKAVIERSFAVEFQPWLDRIRTLSPNVVFEQLSEKRRADIGIEAARREFYEAYQGLELAADFKGLLDSGYRDLINLLRGRSVRTSLVTSGLWRLQARKIEAAEIACDFEPIVVDDARCALGKQVSIEAIAKQWQIPPRNAVVVGDDANAEIKAARNLGMRSIHMLKHSVLGCNCGADAHAKDLGEVKGLLEVWT